MKTVRDIAQWRLCLGCGACAYICPESKVRLVDIIAEGIRPIVSDEACGSCKLCLQVCPAYENDHREINRRDGALRALIPACGPVLEIWEGHSTNAEIRKRGSSGGILTALALYCLERESMHGVLHIGSDPQNPLRNVTGLSRSREELLAKTGSRYAPASACDKLHLIESAPAPCVFIGQPSEVTALRKAERLRPSLAENVGLVLSFFCAGSPARQGLIDLIRSADVDPSLVADVRYRGDGWPGRFAVTLKGEINPSVLRTYRESWSFLQAYRPLSTQLCPDGTGEDADLSCGDSWYREPQESEPGSSLVLVRTEKGRRLLKDAIHAGYLHLVPADPWKLLES